MKEFLVAHGFRQKGEGYFFKKEMPPVTVCVYEGKATQGDKRLFAKIYSKDKDTKTLPIPVTPCKQLLRLLFWDAIKVNQDID